MTDMMTDTPSEYPCLDGLHFGAVSNDSAGSFWGSSQAKFSRENLAGINRVGQQ